MAMTEDQELYFVSWILFAVQSIFYVLAGLLALMLTLGVVFGLSENLNNKAVEVEVRLRRYFSGKTE